MNSDISPKCNQFHIYLLQYTCILSKCQTAENQQTHVTYTTIMSQSIHSWWSNCQSTYQKPHEILDPTNTYIKHNWDSYRQLAVLHTYTAVLISDMSTKRTARLHGFFAQNGPERRRYQKQLVAILTDWWSTPTKHHFILKHLQLHCSNLRLSLCNTPVSRDSETVYNDTDWLMSCIALAGTIFSFEY